MRILLAIPSLRCGGSERVMSILANHWVGEGHELSLATFEPPETDFFALDPRVRRFVLGGTARAGLDWLEANRQRLRAMRSVVRETRAEGVLSFLYTMNLLAIPAAKGLAPVVVAERTDPRFCPIERWQAGLRRLLYPMAAAIVVQTEDVLEGWVPRVTRRVRSYAVPNPVIPPAPPSAWTGPRLSGHVVASAGRLERRKGFDVLIAAFARAAADYPDWSLVILGEGEERAALAAQAAASELAGRVLLPGNGDTSSLFERADIFASASRLEGFPNALLEAMAAGLPVLATDCHSGPRAIVRDGIDGRLVPVDDTERFAAVLRRLMEDRDVRLRLGAGAAQVLDRFGIERIAPQWEQIFRNVQADRR